MGTYTIIPILELEVLLITLGRGVWVFVGLVDDDRKIRIARQGRACKYEIYID